MKQMLNFIAVKKNSNTIFFFFLRNENSNTIDITFVNTIMIKFNWRILNNI